MRSKTLNSNLFLTNNTNNQNMEVSMYKKILTLLFVLSWCFTLSAQDFMEVSPNLKPVSHNPNQEAMWDLLLGFDVTALSGAAGNAGAEWNGQYLYSTRWASNLIHEYSADGTTLIREFSVSGVTGLRDLAFDGTYMYGGAAANTIYQMDFTTNTLIGTISSPVAVRWIAYDEGSDGFWVGNWGDPLTLIDRSGTTLATIATTLASKYGAAYDNVSAGGPFLWIFDQGAGAGTPQLIHQFDITSGTATGVTHDVALEFPANAGIAGGLFTMSDWQAGTYTIGGLLQGVPDAMFVYELGPAGGPTGFTDDFDSYVAGQQLACQNPVDWTTWSNLPCDPTEDAYVSSNYSYSGPNSVVVVENNDLVKPLGVTSGTWYISFKFYIPTANSGYFNTLTGFTPDPYEWAHDSYFDVGGVGRLDTAGAGGTGTTVVPFTWTPGAWNQVIVIVDLDSPNSPAQYWIGTDPSNLTMVATWDWTNGGTKANRIAANDFFGAAATDEMYFDDYYFGDAMPPIIPVELTSFTAVGNNGVVELNWETATEINNHMFEIERKSETTEFRTIGFVEGAGTTTEPQSYRYTDKNVEVGAYVYRLKQIDFNGTYSYSDEVEVNVTAPLSFNLEQNYPNPFNPSTNIKYSVPESGNVKLSVYNLVGEEVAVLVNGNVEAGNFEVTFDASSLPSGVYLYKLQSANSVQTKKMMLLK